MLLRPSLLCFLTLMPLLAGQGHQGSAAAGAEDVKATERGKLAFKSNCGFCHGEDGTGSRAPDLLRSATIVHDERGNLIGSVIKNGRAEKGMPAFTTLKDDQIADIVAFLHHQAYVASHSANVPGDYPVAKLLTGDAAAGKAYFEGTGGCKGCHSITKDLAGIATKFSPVDLQQQIIYPENNRDLRTATVASPNGQTCEGKVKSLDEFNIGMVCQDGWFRSFPLDQVKVEVKDPMAAHRQLTTKYSDADMHNLFAYLETLK